ncbi:MAG TPA: helix-turn-helix transcriptional regulator [Jiangellaceae bacterium]|nr:helix-turn-helix transcriptional regulator [Jiangellaceae bacterium]
MGTRAVEKGPTGRRVAANVRQLRDERRLSLDGLAARLRELGRPILPSGLSKLELGERRIDVDDLVALALALDVAPAALLLPTEHWPGMNEEVALTPARSASWGGAWRWANGEQPLTDEPFDPETADVQRFRRDSRPYEMGPMTEVARFLRMRVRGPFVAEVRYDGERAGVSLRTDEVLDEDSIGAESSSAEVLDEAGGSE